MPYEPILREGDKGSYMVLLQRAVAKVTATLPDGRQALLAIRVSGDLVGEMSALSGAPRSATVTPCGSATTRIIHRREWRPFMHEYPDVALAIAANMAARFRWANQRRLDFASYSATVRLARILVELSEAHGNAVTRGRSVGVDLTQQELATLCGASMATVEKSFRELRDAGLVETGRRQIVVRDMDGLYRRGDLDTP